MKLTYRLLDHPFYQAWNEGCITKEQLSKYAAGYMEFVAEMPVYWQRATEGLGVNTDEAKSVIRDEEAHIELWQKWMDKLPQTDTYPKLTEAMNAFCAMKPSELLGAIHAFEIQQPEVAKTKRAGLLKHYGFKSEDLTYFDEHEDEARHIAFGQHVADNFADEEEFQRGFEKGQKVVYDSLNAFL